MGVGLGPIKKFMELPPNPKVARVAFLSRLRGVLGDRHSYRDRPLLFYQQPNHATGSLSEKWIP
jgi:hypothetical protein